MGAFSGQEPVTVQFDLATDPTAAKNYPLWRAPVGCTVVGFSVVANTTQNAGTAVVAQLVNFGTAGTAIKSSGGTVSAALGGTATAARLTAGAPARTTTMVDAYLAEGEWLTLALTEQGAGWQAGEILRVQAEVVLAKM
jgi:hypothetical protein